MGNDTSVLTDFTRPEWAQRVPHHPAAGRTQVLAILTDAAVIRIALLAVGVAAFLLAVAAVL